MVVISVEGNATVTSQPELAVLCFSVKVEKSIKEESASICRAKLGEMRSLIQPFAATTENPGGAIVKWHTSGMRSSSYEPWDSETQKNLPTVFSTSVSITTTFNDFNALSKFAGGLSSTEYINIDTLSWSLTPSTRASKEREARQAAVQDALTKAGDYAKAMSLVNLEPSEIADEGLMTEGTQYGSKKRVAVEAYACAADTTFANQELELEPKELDTSARINARFVAQIQK